MAELSFQLQTLEPLTGALDILRHMGSVDEISVDADAIADAVGLSERSFGKAIKRLVTKGYMQMDTSRGYRLTEMGHRAVEELRAYDAEAPAKGRSGAGGIQNVSRRLVLVAPGTVVAGQPADVIVGFQPNDSEHPLPKPVDMVVRLWTLNGEPKAPQDAVIELSDGAAQHNFQVTPGVFQQMRIRVQVFQLGPNPDDITVSGGMYVDLNVVASGADDGMVAYGTDVNVMLLE